MIGRIAGKDSNALTYPVIFKEVPVVSPNIPLDNSFAWMENFEVLQWPRFLDNYSKLGFKYVTVFPRNFSKQGENLGPDALQTLAMLKAARRRGYGVLYNESPFHVMWNTVRAADKSGTLDAAEVPEMFTQIDGKRGEHMNILYRDKYFQDEIKRVAQLAALTQPDQIFLDIEWWTEHVADSKKDSRVIAAWKDSGKTWEEFTTDIGIEVLSTLVNAIRAATPQRKISIGLYGAYTGRPNTNSIFEWGKIYPRILDIAQPSMYVQGRAGEVGKEVRIAYEQQQNRDIIPWLTGGTYGEFDSKWTEPMVLESILGGARGVTYFKFDDADPMDFYYHAKALAALGAYPDLLKNGSPAKFIGSNATLRYSYFASGKEALLLVANYERSPQTKTGFGLPKGMKRVRLVGGQKLQVQKGEINLEIPPGKWRLLHFSQ